MGASSRYRFYQYLPFLKEAGINVTVSSFFDDAYLEQTYSNVHFSRWRFLPYFAKRIASLVSAKNYELIWVENEALPWLPDWIELIFLGTKVPYIVEYDDAIFHRYDLSKYPIVRAALGRKINRLMRHSACVIAGNEYIASRARMSGAKKVSIIPTVVDLDRYPSTPLTKKEAFTIGWIGTPKTAPYLRQLQPALQRLCKDGDTVLQVVGVRDFQLEGVNISSSPWSEDTEVELISGFDVGIMPLPNTPWEQGKCGLKLIQYLASSKPVVASPVGVNKDIVLPGINGFLAESTEDWIMSVATLKEDSCLRKRMGTLGRQLVADKYSLRSTCSELAKTLTGVVDHRPPPEEVFGGK